jgi:hypothetical protein
MLQEYRGRTLGRVSTAKKTGWQTAKAKGIFYARLRLVFQKAVPQSHIPTATGILCACAASVIRFGGG